MRTPAAPAEPRTPRPAPVIERLEDRRLMAGQRLFYEGFEGGGPGWTVDTELGIDNRKAWGIPSGFAHTGNRAAGTVNPGIDAVLASPVLNLPAVNQYNEHLYVRWWQYSDYTSRGGAAASIPVVRAWEPSLGTWGPWNVIDPNTETVPAQSKTWGYIGLDLTQFNGDRVQLGFHHYGNANGARGWFVDDVEVTREAVQKPWRADTGFENGFDGWSTTRGMWNIGTATNIKAPGGTKLAGTGLTGTPPLAETSSLVSPAFSLPANPAHQPVTLEFKSFFDRASAAVITVEFQFWMPSVGWSPPNNVSADLADTVLSGYQPGGQWKTFRLPLTNSLGGAKTVPHRLLFSSLGTLPGARGWFIDDVKLTYPGKPTAVKAPEVRVSNQFGELTDGVTRVFWGTHAKNTGGKDLTFTIRNAGNAALTVGAIVLANNVGFTVVQQPAKTVAAGGSTTFKVRMATATVGTKSATIRFQTNDADENPFNFNISGVVKA